MIGYRPIVMILLSVRPSVPLSVTLSIVALRVGVGLKVVISCSL